ncbi:MAG: porin [Lonepinella koalarum]|nr:porin [Lonepinella koalarum]
MKKTLAALIVAATAASANAASVYEKDGTRIDVEGSFRLFLGKDSKDQRGDLKNNGSRLWFKANQEIGNGLSALGAVEMRFDKDTTDANSFGNPRANQLYAGFAHKDVGTLTFGRQETTLDLVQLSDFAYPFGGNNNLKDYADKSIKFLSTEWHGLSIGLDYLFGNAQKHSTATELKNGYGVSAFYNRELAQDVALSLAAGYNYVKYDDNDPATTVTGTKENAWRTAAQITFGKAALGVEFGRKAEKLAGETKLRGRSILVGAKYQVIDPSAVYFQYQNNQEKQANSAKETENKYILGVDYKLHSNVLVFVEGYRSLTKEHTAPVVKSNDTGYGVGLRVFF